MNRFLPLLMTLLLILTGCAAPGKSTPPMAGNLPSASEPEPPISGTPEQNLEYYRQYLEPISYGSLLRCDFGPGRLDSLAGAPMMFAFEDLTGPEKMREYGELYGAAYPQQVVEDCLTAYFEVTPEELRTALLARYYRPEEQVYYYEGGRGGGPQEVTVTASRRSGDLLELDYAIANLDMDTGEMAVNLTGTLTVRPGETGWQYVGCKVQENS